MKNILLTNLGKSIQAASRLSGRHGSALPGFVIERISKNFLVDMLGQLPKGVVIVTGTNGKTTTTKMLTHLVRQSGLRVLTNKTGSNFVRGIISYVVKHATHTAKLPYDIAVIELDEAYAAKFVEQVKPRGVVVLNVSRDQLDRFGEIDTTAKYIQKVVKEAQEFVVLNSQDKRVRQMITPSIVTRQYFGVASRLQYLFPEDDNMYAAVKESTQNTTPSNLVEFVDAKPYKIRYGEDSFELKLRSIGAYNVLNACAALTAWAQLLKPSSDQFRQAVHSLTDVPSAFGRGEIIKWNGKEIILQLVKNPSGFRQALGSIGEIKPTAICVAINDDYADGRDVSWLWDVEFSSLKPYQPIMTAGTRRYDMAQRLKYDELTSETEDSLEPLLEKIKTLPTSDDKVVIFATYTAMLKLRKLLGRQGEVGEI